MRRSRSRAKRNYTELQDIVGGLRDATNYSFIEGAVPTKRSLHQEAKLKRSSQQSISSLSSGVPSHTELSQIQMRARHYLLKYRILDDPAISFSLVNIILEERQKLLEEAKEVSPSDTNSHRPAFCKSTHGQFLPPIQEQARTTIHQNRQEVLELAKWFDDMLAILRNSQTITISDILSYKQTVLNLGLSEIIRMVALTCKERASLLRLVWDSTFEIFQQVIVILTRHSDSQQRENLKSETRLTQMFEQRIQSEKSHYQDLSRQYTTVLDHFKSLIISTRRLKKDKKDLQLKYKLLEYSLESYREGYEVAIEFALQSGDGNIVSWANKILGRLVREKRRKKKKFQRVVRDQLVYRKSVDVVWDWLRRHTDDTQGFELEKYMNVDLVKMHNIDKQEDNRLLEKQRRKNKPFMEGDEDGESARSGNGSSQGNTKSKFHTTRLNHQSDTLNSDCNRKEAFQSDEESKDVDIYQYFKLEDVGTGMDLTYVDCSVGDPIATANKCVQTWTVRTCEASTMTDQHLFPPSLVSNLETNQIRQRRQGKLTVAQQNMSINETDEISGQVSISVRSGSNQKNNGKKNKKIRLQVSTDRSESQRKKQQTKGANGTKSKNNVKVKRKYHRRKRQYTTSLAPVQRSGSTAFIAYDLQLKGRAMHADLQLNKFQDIFEQERERMSKHPQQFMRDLQQRRSYANIKQVQYGSYCNYERCVQKWAVLKKQAKPPQNSFNEYNEVSKKLKQYFDKAIPNSNIMKKKTFRQNTQIFANVAANLHLVAVRDQKASSTLNALNKILSSLLMEQVKQAKKEKEDKEEKQADRFFYPLNALYVDKFINTYGLKEIAEKNMVSTLRNIMGLTHRSEKMRLFAILLGVYDHNVGGDELQLYVRSIVYFDTTGKVALHMRDFNIERLATEKAAVQQNLSKVVDGFFSAEQTAVLQSEIEAAFDQNEPSIQTIVLMLLEAYNRRKTEKVGQYIPLHNYLVNHRTFLGNLIELLKLLSLEAEKQADIIKHFMANLDLIEESNRCITPQRFITTCIKSGLPSITQMCSRLVASIQLCEPPQFFSRKVYVQVAEQNISWLLRVKESWELPIQNSLLQELESALQHEDKHLTQFWWLVTVASLVDKHLQDLISNIIENLNIVTIEDYFNQFKKPK